ncbi:MAG: hypothetical protein ACHQQQ_08915 [Bacteroidota bacterium]
MKKNYSYRNFYEAGITAATLSRRGLIRGVFLAYALISMMSFSAVAQLQIESPANGVVSTLHSQAVIVSGAPNSSVDLYVNGKLATSGAVRIDGKLDFLNISVPSGDVHFDVASSGSAPVASPEQSRTIHVVGMPASIIVKMNHSAIVADGKSELGGTICVRDEWGYSIDKGTISLTCDSGKIVTRGIDSINHGVQISLNDTVTAFAYRAGKNAGTAVITAQMADLKGTAEVELNTTTESFTLVGLATGTGSKSSSNLTNDATYTTDAFPDGYDKNGRLAMYARGTVAKDYLLTASFDSDRRNQNQFFRQLDPDYLYSIYGDNSMLYYDAQATRNLYVKLEHNQSYLYVGDYNTDLTKQEFTLYNRTLNGGKVYLKDKQWNVTGFGSLTDRQVVQKELRGTGLSGFYDLGYQHVTTGSEKIRIETRDRFHSEVVLQRLDRYRFQDYEIDYEQGMVYFKQPVPAMDENGNPVYIVVTFEAISSTANQYIGGGRIENSMIPNFTLGLTGVTEQQNPQNYVLLGGDAKYNLNNKFTLSGEVGHSSILAGQGTAYKIESSISPVSPLTLNGYYRNVESGFFNITQSGSQRELGTEKYGGDATVLPFSGTRLTTQYYKSKQNTSTGLTTVNSASGGIDQQIVSQFSVNASVEDLKYNGMGYDTTQGALATHSTLLKSGATLGLTSNLKFSAFHEQNIGANNDITKPNGTSILADYKVSEEVSLTGSQKWYDGGGGLSSVGINTKPAQGTELYGKYEIGNVISEYRNMLSIGFRNTLKLPYDLTANIGYERAKSLMQRLAETGTQDHTSYSGSVEYLPKSPIKLSAKGEFGDDPAFKRTNIDFGGDYRLVTDLSVISKYRHTEEREKVGVGYEIQNHLITGLAYRPVENDWFNCIGKYEWKTDNNQYTFIYDQAHIISVHAYFEPIRRWESGIKYAFKFDRETNPAMISVAHSHFYLFHSKVDLTNWLDIGGEYRLLRQTEARDFLYGYSAELGLSLIKNVRLAGGYNFKGYKEIDLVDQSLWSKGPFMRVDIKFSEELLGM